jgi:hypothetical protein
MPAVRSIAHGAKDDDYKFSSLVMGVVASAPFQMRVKHAPTVEAAAAAPASGGQ